MKRNLDKKKTEKKTRKKNFKIIVISHVDENNIMKKKMNVNSKQNKKI